MNHTKPDRIILATRNLHKLKEIREIMFDLPVELLSLRDFPGLPDVEETGETFIENALIKAETIYRLTGLLSIADDSGLEVYALKGAPGIHSARFAGPRRDPRANNEELLRRLKDVADEQRGAQFRCVAAIVGRSFKEVLEGIVRGRIANEPRGDQGFGYDPLFIPEGYDQTFAELGEEIKNKISHRALAFEKVKEVIKRNIFQLQS